MHREFAQLLDWFQKSFAEDPATWIGTFAVIGVAILGGIKPVRSWAWKKLKAIPAQIGSRREARLEAAREEGRAEVRRTNDEIDNRPKPRIRWVVGRQKSGTERDWVIFNTGTEAALNVRLEAPSDEFAFMDDAFWETFPGRTREYFRGKASSTASSLTGVTFTIEYEDDGGRKWQVPFLVHPFGW